MSCWKSFWSGWSLCLTGRNTRVRHVRDLSAPAQTAQAMHSRQCFAEDFGCGDMTTLIANTSVQMVRARGTLCADMVPWAMYLHRFFELLYGIDDGNDALFEAPSCCVCEVGTDSEVEAGELMLCLVCRQWRHRACTAAVQARLLDASELRSAISRADPDPDRSFQTIKEAFAAFPFLSDPARLSRTCDFCEELLSQADEAV